MCYFITLGIPASRADLLDRLAACDFLLRRAENPSLRRVLPQFIALFEVTKGGCSCSLALGEGQSDYDKARERYRRKGWSDSKIERAIASREHASETRHGSTDNTTFLNELAAIALECSSLYLYSHWYAGALADEEVNCEGEGSVSIGELLAGGSSFPTDRLLTLTR